jgi:hypothetical protein
MNIKSITDISAGLNQINYAIPFKSTEYVQVGMSQREGAVRVEADDQKTTSSRVETLNAAGTATDSDPVMVVWFGELENE